MRSKISRLSAALLFLLGIVVSARIDAQPVHWAEKLYNPKPAADDLVLPMPCGGAMVFRKIDVPTVGRAKDKPIVLGEEDPNLAYAEGLRQGYLGGGFADPQAPARRYYWLGKYEVSELQWEAVQSNCPAPRLRGRLPQTGVNWYTAVAFAERYTEWLYQHALAQLPQEDGVPGFLRLPTEAADWYRKAAEGGHIQAQRELGLLYAQGRGVAQDYAKTVSWFRNAAERGDASAQNDLGMMYEHGYYGLPQDAEEAAKWYGKAAVQGHALAEEKLKKIEKQLTGGVELVPIKGGCFQMGSPPSEQGRFGNEKPHQVCVEDFRIGKYEVTVGQFRRFVESANYQTEAERGDGCYGWMGRSWEKDKQFNWRNPGFAQEDDHPVVCVSWNDAVAYAKWLSEQTGKAYRLPTEAEWEYAARAGTQTARFWGENPDQGCAYANAADLTAKKQFSYWRVMNCEDGFAYTAPVGHYQENGFGLHDMLGNVWEWTCSGYEGSYAGAKRECDSNNRAEGARVIRGGALNTKPRNVRAAQRSGYPPNYRSHNSGFRLARNL